MKQKKPRKITARYIQNAALFYLQRYASSTKNFRRVLRRKVDRSARAHDTDPNEGYDLIEQLIERYQDNGLLNDTAYATAQTTNLRRRGESQKSIAAKLGLKGLSREDIKHALTSVDEEKEDPEFVAAKTYAKRRKIGPYRLKDRQDYHQKDLAALARRGFSYETICQVMRED